MKTINRNSTEIQYYGGFIHHGNLVVEDDLTIEVDLLIDGDLVVDGDVVAEGLVGVLGNITVKGNIRTKQMLAVYGDIVCDNLVSDARIYCEGDIKVSGKIYAPLVENL